jgi:hypothetical protein
MAESHVTSIAAELLATPLSQARVTSVAAEVLATASSEARVSSIALEALVSVAAAPGVPTSSHNAQDQVVGVLSSALATLSGWLVARRFRGAAAFDLVLWPAARCFRDELLFGAVVLGAGAAGAGFRPKPVCRAISDRCAL